jgi:hypothetical protein
MTRTIATLTNTTGSVYRFDGNKLSSIANSSALEVMWDAALDIQNGVATVVGYNAFDLPCRFRIELADLQISCA